MLAASSRFQKSMSALKSCVAYMSIIVNIYRAVLNATLNECDYEPCLHGATCVDDFETFRCVCRKGYEGSRCESKAYLSGVDARFDKQVHLALNSKNRNVIRS